MFVKTSTNFSLTIGSTAVECKSLKSQEGEIGVVSHSF